MIDGWRRRASLEHVPPALVCRHTKLVDAIAMDLTIDSPREARLSQFWETAKNSRFRLAVFLALNVRSTIQAAMDIRALPCLEARLSSTCEGRAIAGSLKRRGLLKTLSLATAGCCVLAIPATPQAYGVGASKQTLRRKVRAAQKAGVACRTVDDPAEQRALVKQLDRALAIKNNSAYREVNANHSHLVACGLWTVAFSKSGEPLVIAVTPRDGQWSILQAFISLGETQEHSDARYLLTQAVVESLSQNGVQYLVDTHSPSELRNGLRHFQRMLGFRIARVRIVRTANRSARAARPLAQRFPAEMCAALLMIA